MRRLGKPLSRPVSLTKVIRIIKILDRFVPTDAPTGIIPVTSLRGFSGYKISGATNGRAWSVELYGGNFYLVKIQGLEARDMRVPLYVVNHLRANLLPKRSHRVRVHHPVP